MFVVTLFSAVSADQATHSNWGEFNTPNCVTLFPEKAEPTKVCLRAIGGQWVGNRWGTETCQEFLPKSESGEDNKYCPEYPEIMTCCGGECSKTTEKTCSKQGGISKDFINSEGQCDKTDQDSCSDFQAKIKLATEKDILLICGDDEVCAPKEGPKPSDDEHKKDDNKDKHKKEDKKTHPESNAFAMGLSTLAGALVILQL